MKYGLQGHRSQQLCSKGKNVLSLLHYYKLQSIEMLWANDWYWVGLLKIDNFD